MAIRKIVTIGDPVLEKASRPVEKFNFRLNILLDDMKETLYKNEGAGLAAVQVGVLKRVAVIDVGDGYVELINPELIYTEGEQEGEEGCLSVPGKAGIVVRPMKVKVRAQNREGQWCLYQGEGLKARCFCHELEHMDGILYTRHVKEYIDK